jgi:hypothetical protein
MPRRRRRTVAVTVTLVVVLVGLAALPFWHKAADHFHYALPGRVPERVEYKDREFWKEGSCMSKAELANRLAVPESTLVMRRVGTVFGWLTRPRGMYTWASVKGVPVAVFVSGGWGDCRVLYALQGSP